MRRQNKLMRNLCICRREYPTYPPQSNGRPHHPLLLATYPPNQTLPDCESIVYHLTTYVQHPLRHRQTSYPFILSAFEGRDLDALILIPNLHRNWYQCTRSQNRRRGFLLGRSIRHPPLSKEHQLIKFKFIRDRREDINRLRIHSPPLLHLHPIRYREGFSPTECMYW